MTGQTLYFNGIDGASGSYVLPPMTAHEFAAKIRRDVIEPPGTRGPLTFLDATDLQEVGWGIVFPHDHDPAIREALAPLIARRREQAGDLFRELTYDGGSWLRFLADHDAAPNLVDPKALPYYLLLIGDPGQMSFEFQYLLDVPHAVGRLCFTTADEYASYASSALAAETGSLHRPRRLDLFAPRHWDDPNTGLSEKHLARPLADALQAQESWKLRSWTREQADKACLQSLFGGDETSALLFTAGHAVCFQHDDPQQRPDQGALLCYDWPGPQSWPGRIPPEHYFAAADLPDSADLRGLITFHFACFSAGTPHLDSYSRAVGTEIPHLTAEDFVAALPQRLLGHPRGALAVVGHVDLAWPHSFLWRQTGQIAHFTSTLRELMAGKPVGLALEAFGQRHAILASTLTDILEERREEGAPADRESEEEQQLWLWMAHNDARSYILLGDPAVRSPAASGPPADTDELPR